MNIKKLNDLFYSAEGKKHFSEFFDRLKKEQEIEIKQFERFNRIGNFVEFTEKVIAKYNGDNYKNRCYSRGIEPPEDLFWFLYSYAERYGRVCNQKEWNKYGNTFTSALYFCNGYYFNKMVGQGSVIEVIKQNKEL